METRVKSEEVEEKKFAPEFNKRITVGKAIQQSVPIEMYQSYSGQ